jgi:putative acetyltransferase
VNWSEELEVVRKLFQGYRDWVAGHVEESARSGPGIAPGLELIDRLTAQLPGVYRPPKGDVILAFKGGVVVACGAVREIEPGVGDMKRIYVRADHRGPGFGPILTGAVLEQAKALGFKKVRVDTTGTMEAAIQFYQDMGFKPIGAYWPHPVAGALFFEWTRPDR